MRVLVTGANGFVGAHLVTRLVQADWQVAGVQRQGRITQLSQVFAGLDLHPEQLQQFDVIYHLAGAAHAQAKGANKKTLIATNADASVALFRSAVQAGVKKFVWLSSIKVLGDVSSTPFQPADPYNPGDNYARSKVRGEELLLAEPSGHTELAVVRPPLIYGPGVKANFVQLLRWSLSGWPLPLAQANQPRAWLGVRNLVNFLYHLGAPQLARIGGVWHLRDEEESSVVQIVDKISHLAGKPIRLWGVNPSAAIGAGTLVGKRAALRRLFLPLQVNMDTTLAGLDWQPTYRQHEELEQVLKWYTDS